MTKQYNVYVRPCVLLGMLFYIFSQKKMTKQYNASARACMRMCVLVCVILVFIVFSSQKKTTKQYNYSCTQ